MRDEIERDDDERIRSKPCRWTQNEEGYWETDCKNSFVIEEGTPRENRMRYCCYCGATLLFTSHKWILEERELYGMHTYGGDEWA